MSVKRSRYSVELVCDYPDCDGYFCGELDERADGLRAEARQHPGWIKTPSPYGADLCPRHAEEAEV